MDIFHQPLRSWFFDSLVRRKLDPLEALNPFSCLNHYGRFPPCS